MPCTETGHPAARRWGYKSFVGEMPGVVCLTERGLDMGSGFVTPEHSVLHRSPRVRSAVICLSRNHKYKWEHGHRNRVMTRPRDKHYSLWSQIPRLRSRSYNQMAM